MNWNKDGKGSNKRTETNDSLDGGARWHAAFKNPAFCRASVAVVAVAVAVPSVLRSVNSFQAKSVFSMKSVQGGRAVNGISFGNFAKFKSEVKRTISDSIVRINASKCDRRH